MSELSELPGLPDLSELISFARANSPFYREFYAGLPQDAGLEELPIVDHTAFWAANTLDDNQLITAEHRDGLIFKTGGSTGAPRVSFYTNEEWLTMSRTFGAGLAQAGLRPGDRVANLFYAGELYSSFVFTLNTLQESTVPAVQLPIAGGASPEYITQAVLDFGVTVLSAPPTSLCTLARHVIDTIGTLPTVRLALFSGEACYPDQQALLRRAFPGIEVRSIGYASVDAGILAGPVLDDEDPRVHQVFTPDKLVEILDPETGEPIEDVGRPGRVVATDLVRRLMPVIRYPVGDLAEWVDFPSRRLRLLGRADEGARVGPVTVYLDDLRGMVSATDTDGVVSGMQVVLRHHDERDRLILRLVGQAADPDGFATALAARLDSTRPMFADHVARSLIHPLTVEWIEADALLVNPRTGKLIRLLDERAAPETTV
ncbi:phenylacetate--CoA ligase family protein [Psychromicrobium sp. YIM B11713]|uniref:phenylacetate--CoA ligase family protein n=1 Tax=Psychromicrobium sp. YIM B11713 TaxID=3145233 RepID=UPI00374F4F74